MKPELKIIALTDLQPSKTNPRKHFAQPAIEELADSIREQGILEPLLVRPHKESSFVFEIIAGERRFRASAVAGLQAVPCYVRDMSDEQVLEAQLVENLQRDSLTPLEEAVGYRRLLDYGRTQADIARRVGKTAQTIVYRLALLNLPTEAQKAVDEGRLSPTTGALIGRIPSDSDRAAAYADIMQGDRLSGEPLNQEAAKALIQSRYVRSMRNPPFDPSSPLLVPAAGACEACPHYTGGKAPTCASPACFKEKAAAAFKITAEKRAAKIRARIADAKEAATIFPPDGYGNAPDYRTGLVDVAEHPDPADLKAEVERTPPWRTLLKEAEEATGAQIERVLVPDRHGHLRELVLKTDAKLLIEKSGETIFDSGRSGGGPASDSMRAQLAKEREAADQRLAENLVALDRLDAAVRSRQDDAEREIWRGLLLAAISHAGGDGNWLISKWRKLDTKGEASKYTAVRKWACQLSPVDQAALVPILLVAQSMKINGLDCDHAQELARSLEVDLSDVPAAVKKQRAEAKAAKKASAKKAAKEPSSLSSRGGRPKVTPDLKETVREAVAAGETASAIAERLNISVPTVQNIKKELGIVVPLLPAAPAAVDDAEPKPKRANGVGLTDAERADVLRRLDAGESLRTIQAATGVSRPTIAKIKREHVAAA